MAIVFLYPAPGVSTTDEDGNPFPSTGLRVTMDAFYEERCRDGLLVRVDPSASNVLPQPAVYAPVTLSLVTTQLASTPALRDGQYITTSGYAAGADRGGAVFVARLGVSAGSNPYTRINASNCQWQMVDDSRPCAEMFGCVGDGVTDNATTMQAALSFAAVPLALRSGATYLTSATLTCDRNKILYVDGPESARIHRTGTGQLALRVNGTETTFGGPNQQALVTVFAMRGVLFTGGGVFFGTTLNPTIDIQDCAFRSMTGDALDFGESCYFVSLRKCQFGSCGKVRQRAYCDQFFVENCNFGVGSDYSLDLAGPNYDVFGCDFEGNTGAAGNLASIVLRASAIESGYGAIHHNRFGPEGITGPCLYDIYVTNAGTSGKALAGVKIHSNRHFSNSSGTQKIAPVLLNSSVSGLDFSAQTVNEFYTSDLDVVTTATATVYTNNPLFGSVVDELRTVQDPLKGNFQYRVKPDLIYSRRATCGQAFASVHTVCWIAAYSAASGFGLPTIYSCISYPWETRFALGVTTYVHAAADVVHFAEEGSVITTTLNTGASVSNDPVYMGAAGTLSLTPHADYVKIVGRVISLEANGRVRLDFSEPVRYTAMPGGGRFKKGDFAPKAVPVEAGAAASKYIIRGWERLTDSNLNVIVGGAFNGATGDNNALNTDWYEVRTLTGN